MLKIEITDPSTLTKDELIKTARFLMDIAGAKLAPFPQQFSDVSPITEAPSTSPVSLPTNETLQLDCNGSPEKFKTDRYVDIESPDTENASNEFKESLAKVNTPNIDRMLAFKSQSLAPTIPAPPAAAVVHSPSVDSYADAQDIDREWNPEIHARTKKKNPDGTYKRKRGSGYKKPTNPFTITQSGTVDTIEEEFLPTAPVPPAPPAPTSPSAINEENNFDKLMDDMLDLFAHGKLTAADILVFAGKHGVASIPLLSDRPDLFPALREEIDKLLVLRGHKQ